MYIQGWAKVGLWLGTQFIIVLLFIIVFIIVINLLSPISL